MRTITLLWHLLLHWDHTPGSDSRDVICSCGRRWRINPTLRCPVCGEPAIGVCCDILMADLEDGETIVRGGD